MVVTGSDLGQARRFCIANHVAQTRKYSLVSFPDRAGRFVLCVNLLALASLALGCPAGAGHNSSSATNDLESLKADFTRDQKSPGGPVTGVRLTGGELDAALVEQLGRLPRLRSFTLNGGDATESGLSRLGGMKNLRSLSLFRTNVTDSGLAHIGSLTNLEELRLGGSLVSDAGVEHIRRLTKLQWLSLARTKVTDAGLKHLEGLVGLGTLDLDNTLVGDTGLEHLARLNMLQDLRLFNTNVTDRGLVHLVGLRSLQWLEVGSTSGPIGRTDVTDAGLAHLSGLPDLFYLGLWGTKVSADGVGKLHRALPKCRIQSPHGEVSPTVPVKREQIPGTYYWREVPVNPGRQGRTSGGRSP